MIRRLSPPTGFSSVFFATRDVDSRLLIILLCSDLLSFFNFDDAHLLRQRTRSASPPKVVTTVRPKRGRFWSGVDNSVAVQTLFQWDSQYVVSLLSFPLYFLSVVFTSPRLRNGVRNTEQEAGHLESWSNCWGQLALRKKRGQVWGGCGLKLNLHSLRNS